MTTEKWQPKIIEGSPACPNCEAELEYLKARQAEYVFWAYDLENKFHEGEDTDEGDMEFICPECNVVLCTTEEQARLLLGEKSEAAK